MSVNKVIVLGRLGQDPELKHTAGGSAVTNFSVATNESWTDKQGQKQERTEWHRVVVWGKLAELCSQYLSKGRQVYLEGKLQTRSWEDNQGQKRYTTEVQANTVQFLGGPSDGVGVSHSNAAVNTGQAATGQATTGQATTGQAATGQGNGAMLDQNYSVSKDANFTADDIPF